MQGRPAAGWPSGGGPAVHDLRDHEAHSWLLRHQGSAGERAKNEATVSLVTSRCPGTNSDVVVVVVVVMAAPPGTAEAGLPAPLGSSTRSPWWERPSWHYRSVLASELAEPERHLQVGEGDPVELPTNLLLCVLTGVVQHVVLHFPGVVAVEDVAAGLRRMPPGLGTRSRCCPGTCHRGTGVPCRSRGRRRGSRLRARVPRRECSVAQP
jgi:hypothetical protein